MTPQEINTILEIPQWDTASAIKVNEAEYIYNLVKNNNLTNTLEIGFAFARSASHIMAASAKEHIAMDPYQEHYKSMGLQNIKKLGMSDKLHFFPDFSHNVLPQLLKENKKFDFIFIDGDHKFDGILVDFYYANLLCQIDGYIMLHDTWMRSTRLVESYIKTNLKNYKFIKTNLRNISLFQKKAEDNRDGMIFSEFYTWKSYFVYKTITWLSNGKKNIFKNFVIWIKDKIK